MIFVRHGQSIGNMTNDHSTLAHDQLSPNGWQQAERLADRLSEIAFDAIYVSPLRRAWQTIDPYLQRMGRTAEMWPELAEACWQDDRDAPPPVRDRAPKLFAADEAQTRQLVVRSGPSYWPPEGETYREGLSRIAQAKALLLDRHRGRRDKILVIGHEFAGGRLIEMLLGIEPIGRFSHDNTGLTCLIDGANGRFSARFVNRL